MKDSTVYCSCGGFMKPKRNDWKFVSVHKIGEEIQEAAIYNCDLCECEVCGQSISTGFSKEPYTTYKDKDFDAELKKVEGKCTIQVLR